MTKPIISFCALLIAGSVSRADTISLSSLDLSNAMQGWGKAMANRSVGDKALSIGGQSFASGLGTHAPGLVLLDLKKSATRFSASVGVDDEVAPNSGSVEFVVRGDGKVLWQSGVMKTGDAAKVVDVDVTGIEKLWLSVTVAKDGDTYDHADWADAQITYSQNAPVTVALLRREAEILTPPVKPTPRINGAKLFGVRPGAPFLYSIAATGTRPMVFSAKGLPKGLRLDANTGRISGRLDKAGEFRFRLRAKNALGVAESPFKIVVGEQIQLTPPLGYNSWNCWGARVDGDKMLRSARALVAAGLDRHGWNYINIDDAWQGSRGGPLNALQPNDKFPDMKKLSDEVHGMGLKFGIYSTPWMMSYAGFQGGSSNNPEGKWDRQQALGQYSFAKADAQQYAAWGIDYLKYDWHTVTGAPTREMHDALRSTGRDIVLSLSNNANRQMKIGDVASVAQLWRTTEDIRDTWQSMSNIGFSQNEWTPFQKPGHFNDTDMLVVGNLFGWTGNPRPTQLSPDEQYTHISLWSLLGSPLLIGCDLEKLDPFTINLLSNDEVIDIDQDALLGAHGHRVWQGGADKDLDVYVKPLEDGSVAVGLFNRGFESQSIPANWDVLGLKGRQLVRDVWRQKDLGTFNGKYETSVAPHGVVLLKISRAR